MTKLLSQKSDTHRPNAVKMSLIQIHASKSNEDHATAGYPSEMDSLNILLTGTMYPYDLSC